MHSPASASIKRPRRCMSAVFLRKHSLRISSKEERFDICNIAGLFHSRGKLCKEKPRGNVTTRGLMSDGLRTHPQSLPYLDVRVCRQSLIHIVLKGSMQAPNLRRRLSLSHTSAALRRNRWHPKARRPSQWARLWKKKDLRQSSCHSFTTASASALTDPVQP